ncbi:MAG: hypothetical protein K0Q54_2270, partial [Methylobacterium brachiatum]|nr:hypothetical protein [Methylobacterium brachiatum]
SQRTDAMPAHETLHPPTADGPDLGLLGGMHARGTVAPMVGGVDAPDVVQELAVGGRAGALRP